MMVWIVGIILVAIGIVLLFGWFMGVVWWADHNLPDWLKNIVIFGSTIAVGYYEYLGIKYLLSNI